MRVSMRKIIPIFLIATSVIYLFYDRLKRLITKTSLIFVIIVMSIASHKSASANPDRQKEGVFLEAHDIESMTMAEGLRHNFVDDIMRDSRGFLWIGYGGGGLSRYDGYEFVNFSANSIQYPLRGNFAIEMAEDRFGRLWVATEGGISTIDLYTLQAAEIKDFTGKLDAAATVPSWGVLIDNSGKLWIRTGDSIFCFRFNCDGDIDGTAQFTYTPISRGPAYMRDINTNGKPWTGINGEIRELNADFENNTVNTTPVSSSLVFVPDIMVSDIVKNGKDVWIATDRGLWHYNPDYDTVTNYMNDPNDPKSLSQNFINSIGVTDKGRLIVGSLQGLNIYNPINDNFERIGRRDKLHSVAGLNNVFVNKVYVDGNRVWIGTEGGGLSRITEKRLYVNTITNNFNAPGHTFNTPVNAVLVEPSGTVWTGSVEGGLHRSDSNLSHFTHYTAEDGILSHNSVSALALDGDGNLWVGTWGGGVNILSTKGHVSRLKHFITTSDGAWHIGYVGALIWDSLNKLMWVGTSRGLYIYNPENDTMQEAYPGTYDDVFGAIGAVIDRYNHLWIGSSSGLIDIDLRRYSARPDINSIRHINGRFDNPNMAVNERITFLFIDSRDTLWVGTNGNGLYRRVTDNGHERFIGITTSNGLPNDIVHGIAESRSGDLWVSTYKGLVRMSRTESGNNPEITVYDTTDGLTCDCFYWNAATRDAAGNILLGCVDGLVVVKSRADVAPDNSEPLKVNITHVWVDNNEVLPGNHEESQSFCPVSGVKIHERTRSVAFEFSSLDFDNANNGVYSYRLKGFDNEWNELPHGRRFIRYTNLSPGDYTLQLVYHRAGQKFDTGSITELPLTVTPYFYRQWWFILLVIVTLITVVSLIYRHRVNNYKRQRMILQQTVAERTAEIEEQKRQVQQLTMDRIAFFTNITHEFRTPITLILGPIERALKLSYNPQVIEQLHFVERNSKYLLSLVNQLMDFRKVESGKMEIMRTRGNLARFLYNMTESFLPITADRSIEMRLVSRLPHPIMSFDEEALQKVLINLLGNAVKFTPDGGRISLCATVLPRGCGSPGHSIYLSVTDSGNGINPGDIERIFDRFYQGNNHIKYPVSGTAGSGIGLYLCRSLVEIYGGTISARNNRGGRGCTFRVILPLPEDEIPEASPDETPSVNTGDGLTASVAVKPGVPPAERLTILVVEDNDDMRAFIRSILSDRFNVAEARNGEDALKVLANREIDFIISDLMMPVMDGIELSRKVKETFDISHIPFLMLTAKTGRESRLESYRIGVDEYILKPFDEELLLARIDSILKNRRRYQERFAAGQMKVEALNIDEDSRDKKFMDQVMKVIHDNYRNSYFEIGDFAEALGVSRSLLNKKLQNLAGQSAGQLLRTFRLNTARELLLRNRKTRAMNISEIAYEVGFNDSKYFTRCFTKQFNVTPSSILNDE